MNCFPPRHNPDQSEMERQVSHTADGERIQNRARHYVGRILHFVPDVADIVISQIVVHRDQSSAAETEHEATIKGHCSWRKIEGQVSIEVGKAGDDDGYHGQRGTHPKSEGHLAEECHLPT